MLAHRLPHWTNINPALVQCGVLAGFELTIALRDANVMTILCQILFTTPIFPVVPHHWHIHCCEEGQGILLLHVNHMR